MQEKAFSRLSAEGGGGGGGGVGSPKTTPISLDSRARRNSIARRRLPAGYKNLVLLTM